MFGGTRQNKRNKLQHGIQTKTATENGCTVPKIDRDQDQIIPCNVLVQQKVTGCKEELMKLLKGEDILRTNIYKLNASVGFGGVLKKATVVVNIETDSYMLEEGCLPQAFARDAITM